MTDINKSPKHGTTNDTPKSQSQPDGTAAEAPRGETQAQPSGPHGGNPATAGNKDQRQLNPSATTESTEISNAQTKGSPLNDTFGEAGDPHGRGNLEIPDQTVDSGKSQDANFVGNPPTDKKPSTEGAGDIKRKDEEAA